MTTHELKCWPGPYDEIASGRKTFEFRKDDRGYDVGHLLYLRRYNPDARCRVCMADMYTGESMTVKVTSILRNGHGVPEGFVCMSIAALASSTPNSVAHTVIAGALFDFMGYLTSRKERIVLSASDVANPGVDAITDFAKMRGLSLNDAQVREWIDSLTQTNQPSAVVPTAQPEKYNDLTDPESYAAIPPEKEGHLSKAYRLANELRDHLALSPIDTPPPVAGDATASATSDAADAAR